MAFRAITEETQTGSFRPINIGGIPIDPEPQKKKPNIRQIGTQAGKVIDTLGFGGVRKTVGTNLAQIGNALDPRTSLQEKVTRSQELGQTTLKQNIGTGVQLGGLVGTAAAAPAGLAANLGIGALSGASQAGGASLAENESLGTAAKKAGLGATIGAAVSGAVFGIGKLIGKIGDKISTSVIRPQKVDLEDGFSLETVKKYNLGGSLNKTLTKTQETMNTLTAELTQKLRANPVKIDLNSVYDDTIKELTDASKFKGFGANKKILSTLDSLKAEVQYLADDAGVPAISIPEAQVVKQSAGHFGAWQYGKNDPESKASEIVFNTFYNKLKTAIEKAAPEGVKGINAELGKLIAVNNAVLRRIPVAQRSNLISLNEMIGVVGSAANPIALGPTLLAAISRSGTAGAALGKLGQKVAGAAPIAGGLSGLQAQQATESQLESLTPEIPTSRQPSTFQTSVNKDTGEISVSGKNLDLKLNPQDFLGGGTISNVARRALTQQLKLLTTKMQNTTNLTAKKGVKKAMDAIRLLLRD